MSRSTLTKPALASKLIKSFVRRVSGDPTLRVVRILVNNERGLVTTLIDEERFKEEPRFRVYDAEHEILAEWPDDEPPYDFRLFNLGDFQSAVGRDEFVRNMEGDVLYQRP